MIILILTIILAVAAAVRVFIVMVFDDYIPMPVAGTILSLLAAAAVGAVGFLASFIVTHNTDDLRPVMVVERELRALDTGSDTEGRLFLASGYFESGPSYTYLVEREDGGFEMRSVDTEAAIIYQTDDAEPHLVTGKLRPRSTLWSLMPVEGKSKFYVPIGSVQESDFRVSVKR